MATKINACSGSDNVFQEVRKHLKNDDFFQKLSKIVFSALQGIGLIHGTRYLPKVEFAARSVNDLMNFFSAGKHLRAWVYYVTADRIDEVKLSKQVTSAIFGPGKLLAHEAENMAKDIVKEQLTFMINNDIAYKNLNELKAALQTRIDEKLKIKGFNLNESGKKDFIAILKDISIEERPFLNKVSKVTFAVLDILSIKYYLTEWNLYPSQLIQKTINFVGLSQQAAKLGETKVFQQFSGVNLSKTVWALFSFAFGVKFIEALRKLDNSASANEKKQLRWEAVYSLAETALGVASYIETSKGAIVFLALVSNTVGILKAIYSPAREFVFKKTI